MEFVLLLLLIAVNGLFALSEMAVVSSRKSRLQRWADERRPGAAAALALAIVVTAIAFLALVAGELVPKRLALANPEWLASLVAPPMTWLARAAAPLVRLLGAATDAVLKVLGLGGKARPPIGEEEIKVLMEQGAKAGVFEKHEPLIVSRRFRLGALRVTGVMTPWPDIVYSISRSRSSGTWSVSRRAGIRAFRWCAPIRPASKAWCSRRRCAPTPCSARASTSPLP
jgi:putative hemolysin